MRKFFYHDSAGKALCVCEESSGVDSQADNSLFKCFLCNSEIKTEKMRLHIGFRILTGGCGPEPC